MPEGPRASSEPRKLTLRMRSDGTIARMKWPKRVRSVAQAALY